MPHPVIFQVRTIYKVISGLLTVIALTAKVIVILITISCFTITAKITIYHHHHHHYQRISSRHKS